MQHDEQLLYNGGQREESGSVKTLSICVFIDKIWQIERKQDGEKKHCDLLSRAGWPSLSILWLSHW